MKKLLYLSIAVLLFSCKTKKAGTADDSPAMNALAEKYVRLGLDIGQYDEVFVDAYYGPDSLKPTAPKQASFPKDSFLTSINDLLQQANNVAASATNDTLKKRATWIAGQLRAFDRRVRIFSGENPKFDEESKDLFGVVAPSYPESHFQKLLKEFETLLPGKGAVSDRFQQLANRFIIPKDKLDTVFKVAIAECRKRTLEHLQLPASESFKLEFVTDKPWSGYNWYKGNYQSLIQVNTDLNIFIDRVIDVGSHESYPGHHVYNMLLEKNLYRDKGWVEISMYPLFSPQSLIAEGSANYGIDVVLPGTEKNRLAKEVLLPLAGLDTTGLDLYFTALGVKSKLNYVRNEVARALLDSTMTEEKAVQWLMQYGLSNEETAKKSIRFIRANRSYVINYNYGQDLVAQYIEAKGGSQSNPAKRWELFEWILKNPITPDELLAK
ncbi:MAG TPA: hypothetical protein VF476_14200 [Chitinophagaceae bacterium]